MSDVQLGAAIGAARRERSVKQGDLADLLQVPRSAISDIERGSRKIGAVELALICDRLGIPLEELMRIKPVKPSAAGPRVRVRLLMTCDACGWAAVADNQDDAEREQQAHQACPIPG